MAIHSCSSYISPLLINIQKEKQQNNKKVEKQIINKYNTVTARVAQSVYRSGYGLDDPGFESRYGKEIFLFSKKSRTALGPPSLPFSTHLGSFPEKNSDSVKLTTDFHLVPRLRVSGATPFLSLCAFMDWTGITLPFTSLCFNSSSYAQDFLINNRHDIFESFKIMNAIRPTLTPGASSYMTQQYLAMSRIRF
jgi:hypothetical protein